MNFTRDPIIETVITPREGCKLVVRSSKGIQQEDFFVDAVEVVSFGHALFFRSIERPKSFLVPVSDYEIFESKEPKMVLKTPVSERAIKIGGGKELQMKPAKEPVAQELPSEVVPAVSDRPQHVPQDRKQKDKRRKNKRGRDRHEQSFAPGESSESSSDVEGANASEVSSDVLPITTEVKEKAPTFISKLFPPPPTLIKETLSRYKTVDPALEDVQALVPPVVEPASQEAASEPKLDVTYEDLEGNDFMDFPVPFQDDPESEE